VNVAQLEVSNITKRFGSLVANDRISLSVSGGEVLAILGENGAGKSTLMKVVSGFLRPDAGEIRVNGSLLPSGNPEAAIRAGIGMIHQHFMLIPRMTVMENLILGFEPRTRWGQIDHRRARSTVRQLADRFGMPIDPDKPVERLTVGEQQRVEILKAFYRGAEILILDEPTALLTPQESEHLFESIREFSRQGLAVIFISHKLDEVLAISQRVLVIRSGRVVDTVPTASTDAPTLARLMVGRDVNLGMGRRGNGTASIGEPILTLDQLEIAPTREHQGLGPLSLELRAGEIMGIAGVDGNGQQELAETVAGLLPHTRGTLRFAGESLENLGVRDRLARGLAYVPADRQGEGLVLDFKIWENFILRDYYRPPYRRGAGMDVRLARQQAEAAVKAFDIRPQNIELPARALSGGNQQKLLLAREMSRKPRVMVVAQPTRGLDVGAIEYVHQQLMALADGGTAILLISLELDELMKLSDRIAVLFRGKIQGVRTREQFNREEIGLLMTGQTRPEVVNQ